MRSKVDEEPRFAADCMLGTLAKWLRVLGYDTFYRNRVEDADLVSLARSEGRILLTRDRRLTLRRQAPPFLLIESQRAAEQLRQVAAAFELRLDGARVLTRCLRCNETTLETAQEEAAPRIPPYVLQTQERFRRCPSCERIYWGATHRDAMLARIRQMVGPDQTR